MKARSSDCGLSDRTFHEANTFSLTSPTKYIFLLSIKTCLVRDSAWKMSSPRFTIFKRYFSGNLYQVEMKRKSIVWKKRTRISSCIHQKLDDFLFHTYHLVGKIMYLLTPPLNLYFIGRQKEITGSLMLQENPSCHLIFQLQYLPRSL